MNWIKILNFIDGIFEEVKEIPLVQFDLEGTFSKETVCIA